MDIHLADLTWPKKVTKQALSPLGQSILIAYLALSALRPMLPYCYRLPLGIVFSLPLVSYCPIYVYTPACGPPA